MNMTEKKYKQHMTIVIVIALILIGGAYYAGGKHATNKLRASFGGRGATALGGAAGARGAGRFGSGGGLVTGTVLSKDDTSITVGSKDGSSKIVLYSGSTQVLKSTSGTPDDIAVGSNVSAQGTQNSDGSVTASSIQLRPAMTPGSTGAATPTTGTNAVQ